jgi:hypothetical protein
MKKISEKVLFSQVFSDFWDRIVLIESFQSSPACLSDNSSFKIMGMEYW